LIGIIIGAASPIGGGIFNSNGNPTIANCLFRYNRASLGGAVYNDYGSPKISSCSFNDNSVLFYGDAIYNIYSSPVCTNCITLCKPRVLQKVTATRPAGLEPATYGLYILFFNNFLKKLNFCFETESIFGSWCQKL